MEPPYLNLPSPPSVKPLVDTDDGRRLWIGNLDPATTEFQLVKLLQKYGPLEKFDMMYHKNGPNARLSRGYAFATYKSIIDAKLMKQMVNGLRLGSRNVVVKWAKNLEKDDLEKPNLPEIKIPALVGAKEEIKPLSREAQIRAIENKLKLMQEKPLEVNEPSTSAPILMYQQNKYRKETPLPSYRKRHKPYNRRL